MRMPKISHPCEDIPEFREKIFTKSELEELLQSCNIEYEDCSCSFIFNTIVGKRGVSPNIIKDTLKDAINCGAWMGEIFTYEGYPVVVFWTYESYKVRG
jgi:hypothetical protein